MSEERTIWTQAKRIAPGVALSFTVAAASMTVQRLELAATGRAPLEALVIAILMGIAVRTLWRPGPLWAEGARFSGHEILEFAVMLLGASLSFATISAAGPRLILGIVLVVVSSIASSYAICRLLDLTPRMAVLVACGNSICGNSAIATIAPVIGAEGKDVAASISFTAFLGVALALGLPMLGPTLGLDHAQYGVFAGMTSYAVPQVLAATLPVSLISQQIGTVVKLVRVLMLAPVVLFFSLAGPRLLPNDDMREEKHRRPQLTLSIFRFVPWFIIGFLLLAGARSLGAIPMPLARNAAAAANVLTVVAMAALGLAVDLRDLKHVGARVTAAVVCSLVALAVMSLALIYLLGPV